ncbi:MAG: hypothetical protein WD227_07175 [Vicinamibacterales bacterium]
MMRGRLSLIALVALIVTLGLGYAWGAAGRWTVETALEDSHHQLDLADARGALLDARVSLYNNNFGDASRRFEDAKTTLRRVKDRLQDDGKNEAALSIDAALRHLDEAQQLAGQLDPAANSRAGQALEAIRVATER